MLWESNEGGAPHIVPLATQAKALADELRVYTGRSLRFSKCALRVTSNKREYGSSRSSLSRYQRVLHGFRATARTMLDEIHEVPIEHIEHQLAHSVRDPNGRAYNRTRHLRQRAEMMQLWADYLSATSYEASSKATWVYAVALKHR